MSAADKQAMLRMMGRSSQVIDDELRLLTNWGNAASSHGRRTRCGKWRNKIQQGPRTRMDDVLSDAKSTPAASVTSPPSNYHDAIVSPNELEVSFRSGLNVNSLTDAQFTNELIRTLENSKDAVRDAQTVFRDCT